MKKLFLICIFAISFMAGVNFAATPSFDFVPASGSQLKLHCNYNFNISVNPGGQKYNAFAAAVKFNALEVSGSHKAVNSPFTDNTNGFVTGGNLYRAYGALPGGQRSIATSNAATFGFKTIANITGTVLQFTDLNGGPITFGPATTADGITLNGYDVSSADILTVAYDASYLFNPLPCVIDSDAPIFSNMNPVNDAYPVLSGAKFSALVYDRTGVKSVVGPAPLATNSTRHYRYSGLNTGLTNYQAVPSNVYVDNQEGVNSGTIKLTVSCPTCVSFGGPHLLSGTALNLAIWTGDASHNPITWQNKDRGYTLRFNPPSPYEIEKQVFINGVAVDNLNYSGQIHTGSFSLSFNAPRPPVITPIYPINAMTYVDRRNNRQFKFYITDDRAGVDTGSITITIPTIMSGSQVLMTGYTYSGSDLEIILSGGAPGAGNAGSYRVQFTGKRNFASNTGIRVTGFVLDLAGNAGYLDMMFFTRPSCQDWGCADIFQVITLTGNYAGPFHFSGSLIIVTGFDLNSPYPYLTGVNGDILMCGDPYSGFTFTGNIPLADTSGASVLGSSYTGTKLYITGLNFTVQNGVIVVAP